MTDAGQSSDITLARCLFGGNMRTNITLQQLAAFVEVASSLNFRSAAHKQSISQPAISRTISGLEVLIDARLFDRDTRHVALTPAGQELLPIATRILDNVTGALSELSQFLEGRSGHLTIATLPSTGVAFLVEAIAAFRRQRPEISYSLVEAHAEAIHSAIDDGSADVGICVRPESHLALRFQPLLEDSFVLICRNDDPLAKRTSVQWSVFRNRPFIASRSNSSIRRVTDAAFLQHKIHNVPIIEYPSVAIGGAMIEAGLGITALPRLALPLIHAKQLTTVPLERPALSRSIGLVTRAGRSLSPACHHFMEVLTSTALRG